MLCILSTFRIIIENRVLIFRNCSHYFLYYHTILLLELVSVFVYTTPHQTACFQLLYNILLFMATIYIHAVFSRSICRLVNLHATHFRSPVANVDYHWTAVCIGGENSVSPISNPRYVRTQPCTKLDIVLSVCIMQVLGCRLYGRGHQAVYI